MTRIRLYITCLILVVLLANVPAVFAQTGAPDRDGDGLADHLDRCPDDFGPSENGGCPVVVDDPGSTSNTADSDGDGLNDGQDSCPELSGPADNGGCPILDEAPSDQPAAELKPLPQLPLLGPCVMATAGQFVVNIRMLPSTEAPVVGAMDPQQFYPVHYFFDNLEGERWNQTNDGLAAGWVTRLGGICRGLAVLSYTADEMGNGYVGLVSQFGLSMDELMFNPQPEPPADPARLFMPEYFPFPDPAAPQLVLLARFGADSSAEPLLLGELLPAVQDVLVPDDQTETTKAALFVRPGDLVGFNPQPEPPADPFGEVYFQILLEPASTPPQENAGEDATPGLQLSVAGMNLGEMSLQTCESSMLPTEGEFCVYASEAAQVAVCFTSEMNTYCIYGHPPEPG